MAETGVDVGLRGNNKDYDNAIEKSKKKTDGFFDSLTKKLTMASALGTYFATTMQRGLSSLQQSVTNLIGSFVKLESTVVDIINLVDGTTKQVSGLSKEIVSMSAKLGTNMEDTAQAIWLAVSSGVELGDSFKFVESASKLAVAGTTDVTTTVDALTSIMATYGIEMDKVADVSDKLFMTQNFAKATLTDIAEQIGDVAPMASLAAVSLDELLAAFSVVTVESLRPAEAVTALKQAIQNMTAPTEESRMTAEKMGIAWGQAALNQYGFKKVLDDAINSENASNVALRRLFGSADALNAIVSVSRSDFEAFDRVLKKIPGSTDIVERAFRNKKDTVAGAWQTMLAEMRKTTETEMNAITRIIKSSLDGLTSFFRKVGEGRQKEKIERQLRGMHKDFGFGGLPSSFKGVDYERQVLYEVGIIKQFYDKVSTLNKEEANKLFGETVEHLRKNGNYLSDQAVQMMFYSASSRLPGKKQSSTSGKKMGGAGDGLGITDFRAKDFTDEWTDAIDTVFEKYRTEKLKTGTIVDEQVEIDILKRVLSDIKNGRLQISKEAGSDEKARAEAVSDLELNIIKKTNDLRNDNLSDAQKQREKDIKDLEEFEAESIDFLYEHDMEVNEKLNEWKRKQIEDMGDYIQKATAGLLSGERNGALPAAIDFIKDKVKGMVDGLQSQIQSLDGLAKDALGFVLPFSGAIAEVAGNIFANIFGASPGKTMAERVAEAEEKAWEELTKRINKQLDQIGKEQHVEQQKLDILKTLKDRGVAELTPEQISLFGLESYGSSDVNALIDAVMDTQINLKEKELTQKRKNITDEEARVAGLREQLAAGYKLDTTKYKVAGSLSGFANELGDKDPFSDMFDRGEKGVSGELIAATKWAEDLRVAIEAGENNVKKLKDELDWGGALEIISEIENIKKEQYDTERDAAKEAEDAAEEKLRLEEEAHKKWIDEREKQLDDMLQSAKEEFQGHPELYGEFTNAVEQKMLEAVKERFSGVLKELGASQADTTELLADLNKDILDAQVDAIQDRYKDALKATKDVIVYGPQSYFKPEKNEQMVLILTADGTTLSKAIYISQQEAIQRGLIK